MLDSSIQDNPLRPGLRMDRTPEPATMVIFGATGDLTSRKLVPALYNLTRERRLPGGFSVVGFARRDWDDEHFRQVLLDGVNANSRSGQVDQALWETFAQGVSYHRSSFDDPAGYAGLVDRLTAIDAQRGTGGNRVFYLATPPESYPRSFASSVRTVCIARQMADGCGSSSRSPLDATSPAPRA
jgi:glucose-6-phosphate 1-dehydrogenase